MRAWLIVAALALPAAVRSQQADPLATATEKIPPVGTRVRIEAAGILARRQTATILRRSGDTLTLAIKGDDPVAVPLSRVSSFETSLGTSRRRGMLRGAIVIGAFGAALHVLNTRFSAEHCDIEKTFCVEGAHARITAHGLIRGAAIGASFGAALGAYWPTESWRPVYVAPRMSIGVSSRSIMTAVR